MAEGMCAERVGIERDRGLDLEPPVSQPYESKVTPELEALTFRVPALWDRQHRKPEFSSSPSAAWFLVGLVPVTNSFIPVIRYSSKVDPLIESPSVIWVFEGLTEKKHRVRSFPHLTQNVPHGHFVVSWASVLPTPWSLWPASPCAAF